jgi:DNA-binding response OmpR family regulator
MKALIAEDNLTTRQMLESALSEWGYEVRTTANGAEAWELLQTLQEPTMVLLDWAMPVLDGVEVCRRARQLSQASRLYIIMITARGDKEDIVTGLEAGADDYVVKPFDPGELRARLHTGDRIVQLQKALADRVTQLESALARVKQLQGLLPICGYCKKIRDDHNYWQKVESYISAHADVKFSHGVCPECFETIVKPELEALNRLAD